jgi:polyhydroxyalkanoate synthesis regulator phasin
MDLSIQAIEAECNTKERDIVSYKNRIQELEKTIEKLNNEISTRKASER